MGTDLLLLQANNMLQQTISIQTRMCRRVQIWFNSMARNLQETRRTKSSTRSFTGYPSKARISQSIIWQPSPRSKAQEISKILLSRTLLVALSQLIRAQSTSQVATSTNKLSLISCKSTKGRTELAVELHPEPFNSQTNTPTPSLSCLFKELSSNSSTLLKDHQMLSQQAWPQLSATSYPPKNKRV